jgi:hypothetical protein
MDLIVTVPKKLWEFWIDEGDAVGAPPSGEEWGFRVGAHKPPIYPGEKLYIIAWGKLRGYAPITRVAWNEYEQRWMICRRGNAVAVTIPEEITGFRGYRKRWWDKKIEFPFPDWRNPNAHFPNIK